jgi:hypothetical protein
MLRKIAVLHKVFVIQVVFVGRNLATPGLHTYEITDYSQNVARY